MTSELARIEVTDPAGVFAARHLGRALAAELGMERQDQLRVATALSEVSRSAVMAGQRAMVAFQMDDASLALAITLTGAPADDGVGAATRLMDRVEVAGSKILMTKRRPPGVRPDRAAIAAQVAAFLPESVLDELRRQNQDLIAALDDLRRQKEQLELLNGELADTNAGVMALYAELSEELEQTNRGVVALYAELDEKSERLRAASESKNRFWANISHELRTPLNSIIGLTRLLAEPVPDAPMSTEQLYQVQLIRNSGSALLAIVNDLLDVAKAESGQLRIEPAIVQLPALLGRLRALVRPLAENAQITVTVSDEGAPETVLTDELALTSILRNLLSNSIKYTNEGEVRLTVETGESDLAIRIADTGIGIPRAQQTRVFEEFYQVPGARRGGTGLGLPYARRLTELLGGELTLTSEPGLGTTVVVRLPHGPARAGTVVVADDDEGFRKVLVGLLDGIADQVLEAADGARALELVGSGQVDLILVDLVMPGLDGTELLERLPAALPVVVITGLDAGPPRRAAAVIRKDELTRERLAFAIRRVSRSGE
jgi:signal transduction histidine kinase/CheY-like chemotaxis protein